MRTRTATTVLGAVVAGAALLAPGSAYAATGPHSEVHVDAPRDVAFISGSGSNAGEFTPAPTRTQGDILTLTSTHAASTVRMSARLGALLRPGSRSQDGGAYGFAIHTSANRGYVAVLELVGTSGTRFHADLERNNGGTVRCKVVGRINATSRTVSVVVPRSCLGRPAWVRTGMGSVVTTQSRLFIDDARVNGASPSALNTFPTLGKRLYH